VPRRRRQAMRSIIIAKRCSDGLPATAAIGPAFDKLSTLPNSCEAVRTTFPPHDQCAKVPRSIADPPVALLAVKATDLSAASSRGA